MKIKKSLRNKLIFGFIIWGYKMATINREYDSLINKIAKQYGEDAALIKAIIKQESQFKPTAHNTKGEDSRGLGQMQLYVAKNLGFTGAPEELFKPEVNIKYMCLLLIDIRRRYSSLTDIIATYNAGKVRLQNGAYSNLQYVIKVLGNYVTFKTDLGQLLS